jgi:hypothetical protein
VPFSQNSCYSLTHIRRITSRLVTNPNGPGSGPVAHNESAARRSLDPSHHYAFNRLGIRVHNHPIPIRCIAARPLNCSDRNTEKHSSNCVYPIFPCYSSGTAEPLQGDDRVSRAMCRVRPRNKLTTPTTWRHSNEPDSPNSPGISILDGQAALDSGVRTAALRNTRSNRCNCRRPLSWAPSTHSTGAPTNFAIIPSCMDGLGTCTFQQQAGPCRDRHLHRLFSAQAINATHLNR